MTLKLNHHVLVCLEEKNYSRKVLLRGALLAKKYGYTFEVLFFCSVESRYTMFHLLNLAESKKLSERLGAEKFTIKRTKNEWKTAKELVSAAKNNHVKEIIMSGAKPNNNVNNPFWKRAFFFDKYNYILKNIPDIILVVINHSEYNPFGKEVYKNGRQSYLVKKNENRTAYFLSDKPFREKDISGLFFQEKNTNEYNGIFAFIRNGKVRYVYIRHGKTNKKIEAERMNENAMLYHREPFVKLPPPNKA
ncbi:hypothetical protein [Oceanobacillus jeddahense]|uniref:Universal stress protein n=1 Tax=Oceanobacillus jeddahense TaxID=1462527 RepID=A0ABY5JLJ6_9BACI|nr:hypothetical protein [Oceanobacillus jeddahense]UUI01168.1 hypothetical protein NP439_13970 [Oceanobacillus jeddahense]